MPPPASGFDRIARAYRLLEYLTLGPALSRVRTAHLPSLLGSRNALVLGDGDGRFLAALLRSNPRLTATAMDASGGMLHLLAARCSFAAGRLLIVQADARTLPASLGQFDLVATHFFLDCFTDPELATLIPAICRHLHPGAAWVLSDFRIPAAGPLRLLGRLLVRSLYVAFRLLTGLQPTRLPDFAAHLHRAGLRPVAIRHSLGGLLTSELWQLPAPAGLTKPR